MIKAVKGQGGDTRCWAHHLAARAGLSGAIRPCHRAPPIKDSVRWHSREDDGKRCVTEGRGETSRGLVLLIGGKVSEESCADHRAEGNTRSPQAGMVMVPVGASFSTSLLFRPLLLLPGFSRPGQQRRVLARSSVLSPASDHLAKRFDALWPAPAEREE